MHPEDNGMSTEDHHSMPLILDRLSCFARVTCSTQWDDFDTMKRETTQIGKSVQTRIARPSFDVWMDVTYAAFRSFLAATSLQTLTSLR
jgi:hypothetical protein